MAEILEFTKGLPSDAGLEALRLRRRHAAKLRELADAIESGRMLHPAERLVVVLLGQDGTEFASSNLTKTAMMEAGRDLMKRAWDGEPSGFRPRSPAATS